MDEVTRAFVVRRAGGLCEYCQSPADYSPADFAIEHVFPRSRGGTDDTANLAYSCQGCNNRKFTATTARDPLTDSVVSLYDPRRDAWSEHFQWTADGGEIIGSTAAGRATIERLQLNRLGLRNLRAALMTIGRHPSQRGEGTANP